MPGANFDYEALNLLIVHKTVFGITYEKSFSQPENILLKW